MMLILFSQDLIVLEGHDQLTRTRISWYSGYEQKVQNLLTSSNESESPSGTNLYKDVECEALREIVKEYNEQIIEVPKVLRYVLCFKDIIIRESIRKYLQRNFKKVNMIIFQNIEGKLYVYWTYLTIGQLVILHVTPKLNFIN